MTIAGKDLSAFSILVENPSRCLTYAASQMQMYVMRATGKFLEITQKKKHSQIVLSIGYGGSADGFKISCKRGNLYLTGQSERGVIYAAWSFLEKCIGWRFFAAKMRYHGQETGKYMQAVEKALVPEIDSFEEGDGYEENPVLLFRDIFGHASVDEEWCVKNRINGDIWGLKNVPDYMGGSETFASMGGHSFQELLPEKRYFSEHPEYFSFINGAWHGGGNYQICLTNPQVAHIVAQNAIAILRKKPNARYISVSQNDNDNFCQCEMCRKAEKEMGRGNLLYSFVNTVADKIKEEFPNVMIHTYAYETTVECEPIKLHDNVTLQYCLRYCRGHTLTDSECRVNKIVSGILLDVSAKCKELFIYDYLSSEAYTFQPVPDIYRMRENMRFLADCKVKGIYAETDIFCLNSPCMEELRDYLYAKLVWNPYMSEDEYSRHITEFLQAYYGPGWRHVKNYLDIWVNETRDTHYESVTSVVLGEDGHSLIGEDGKTLRAAFIPKEKLEKVCAQLESELDQAQDNATAEYRNRIEILRVAPLWNRLYHTMDNILQNGSEEDKKKAIEDNRKLCSLMRLYCMKYTSFIAMTNTSKMYDDFSFSPKKWQYWGSEKQYADPFSHILKIKNIKKERGYNGS